MELEYPLAAWVKCMEHVFRGCSKKGNKDCSDDLKEQPELAFASGCQAPYHPSLSHPDQSQQEGDVGPHRTKSFCPPQNEWGVKERGLALAAAFSSLSLEACWAKGPPTQGILECGQMEPGGGRWPRHLHQ